MRVLPSCQLWQQPHAAAAHLGPLVPADTILVFLEQEIHILTSGKKGESSSKGPAYLSYVASCMDTLLPQCPLPMLQQCKRYVASTQSAHACLLTTRSIGYDSSLRTLSCVPLPACPHSVFSLDVLPRCPSSSPTGSTQTFLLC